MNPLLPVYSQRTFLLDALNSLAESATAAEAMVASSLIEDCLVSLALEEMYHIVQVQGRAGYGYQGTVLDQALDAIGRKLYPSDSGYWSPYWQRVRETLKYPASQLEALQARLLTTQWQEGGSKCPLVEYLPIEEDPEVPLELLHLPELERVVAVPLQAQCYLDLERVQAQEGWVVSGEYYPFEIHVEDLTFVVSSAGEVVLPIQNFPDSLVRQVLEKLRWVAQTLYTVRRPLFMARVEEADAVEFLPPSEGE